MTKPRGDAAQFGARLREIADTLGIPVSHFYDEQAPPLAGEVLALIRVYAAISDVQGRQRVLSFARREAKRSSEASGGEHTT